MPVRSDTARVNATTRPSSPTEARRGRLAGPSAMRARIPAAEQDGIFQQAAALLEGRNGAGNRIDLTQTIRITVGYRSL